MRGFGIAFLFLALGTSPLLEAQAPPPAPDWMPAGSLARARDDHTATLLPSGKVLVAGGSGSSFEKFRSVELYDPARGTWSPTGSLAVERSGHTATLLPSGEVLVVGGGGSADAELYDPGAGRWRSAGFAENRSCHTATLLPSGKLLIAGGWDGTGYTASAGTYDPATGVWESTGALLAARCEHTAVLLPSGEVLVAGGFDGTFLASAELYDPVAGTWRSTGVLATPRHLHTATLLPSGQVLAVGGKDADGFAELAGAELYDPASGLWTGTGSLATERADHTASLLPSGRVLVAGGSTPFTTGTVEVYDPAAGAWESLGELLTPRERHTATLLPSGGLLVAGGKADLLPRLASSELHDTVRREVRATGSLATARRRHTATLLPSGQVLVAGGDNNLGGQLAGVEVYDPASGAWQAAEPLGTARYHHTATLLPTGGVLVAGGVSPFHTASAELFDPGTGTWRDLPPMETARELHTATLLPSGKVLVAGGETSGFSPASAELFDPATSTWEPTGGLLTERSEHTATLLPSGEVLIAGGVHDLSTLSSAELYDPVAGTWRATGSLATPRSQHTATLLPSGKVLVAGGTSFSFDDLGSAELYDPATGTWQATGSLRTPRFAHTATLLPSGLVAVAGGIEHLSPAIVDFPPGVELYDPAAGTWRTAASLGVPRQDPTATLLLSGDLLFAGGWDGGLRTSVELLGPAPGVRIRRPEIHSATPVLRYGEPLEVTGSFRDDAEGSGGNTRSSAVDYPLVRLQDVDGAQAFWLVPDTFPGFRDDPMTLAIADLPAGLTPGHHLLTVVTAGIPGASAMVELECSVAITGEPADQTVELGASATFAVATQGGRHFQWRRDGADIPGATGPSYVTPPVLAADAGTAYTVVVDSGCVRRTSAPAVLRVVDENPPAARVLSPGGGEFWVLSGEGAEPNVERVTWEMADDLRVCRVEVALLFSVDGGASYRQAAPGGGLPAGFGAGGACPHPGELTTSLAYEIPAAPPSGSRGSLYKVEVRVADAAGNVTAAESAKPFFIVQPNPDRIRTLIFTHLDRMVRVQGIGESQKADLATAVQDLANHPRVQGLVVDLGGNTDLGELYAAWDADPADPGLANRVLFGTAERDGLHDLLRDLLQAYGGTESIVLVGDDRIVPMARIQDRTALLPEETYPDDAENGDLTPGGTTVGQALEANKYLTDDPLAVLDPVEAEELNASLFLPDLAIGRLVETPAEIVATVATFISQDGVLDLAALDHKVQVTGYDFLRDSASRIRRRWESAFGAETPVDGELIGQTWDDRDLLRHLCGDGGAPFGLVSLNGHAVHHAEGIPGSDPFDIRGLATADLVDPLACGAGPLDLAGSVVYAVGCHGGLPVAGSDPRDRDRSLDLPQAFLSRGALAYVANSGYGWGLLHGIGYGERLVELFTEELSRGGTVTVGEAVRAAKERYFLEAPRFDPYDEKTLMQWTLFGLPMVAVDPGLPDGKRGVPGAFAGPPPAVGGLPAVERLGAVRLERRRVAPEPGAKIAPPAFLTRLQQHWDFTADGVYAKYDASGTRLGGLPGCADPASCPPGCPDPEGCYYTLNALVERGTGVADRAIQPYLIHDSRLSGTSQHGILWMGGEFQEERGWVPVFAQLMSNGGDGSDHGAAPRMRYSRPHGPRTLPGEDPPECRASDRELNSMVLTAGEVLKERVSDPSYSIQRIYREIDLEVFYFNDVEDSSRNCDRDGPQIAQGPFGGAYHRVAGETVEWAVPASDGAGVWRVVVVTDDGTVDGAGRGRWRPLELAGDGGGTWRGSRSAAGSSRLTYVVQAVDRRGNVRWLDFVTADLPSSGVPLGLPDPVDVEVARGVADLGVTVRDAPDPVVAGGLLAYTVDVSNRGPDPASAVTVTSRLPAGASLVAVDGGAWRCGASAGVVTCELDRLEAGAAAPAIVVVTNAPGSPGTILHRVAVESPQSDPNPLDDEAFEATQVVGGDPADVTPPAVAWIDTVSGTGGGELAPGEATAATLTQLAVTFSEPVAGAGDAGRYRLVAAGPDGELQTGTCAAGLAGDDGAVAIDAVAYGGAAGPRTAGLWVHGGRSLPRGAYRLLICAGVEDAAGHPLGEVRHDFAVTVEHRLRNSNFDRDLAGWLPNAPPPSAISHAGEDAGGAATSGSARLSDLAGPEPASLSQCLAGEVSGTLVFGGAARIAAAGGDEPGAFALLEAFASADCGGAPMAAAATAPLAGDTGGSWRLLPGGSFDVPAGAGSVLVTFAASAEGGSEVRFDDLFVYAGALFADGFETGELSRWSGASP